MSHHTPCQALDPVHMPAPPKLLSRLLDAWGSWRDQARVRRELNAMADLSAHTLDDINAPCWMYLQATGQREAEQQRRQALHMSNLQPW
jgi:uncharacterized protein YjiS (DUF1127 family)